MKETALVRSRSARDIERALPGETGNSIIGGHRDTHFRFLRDLQPGDALLIENRSGIARFEVSRTAVVDKDDVMVLADTSGATLTLITCFPFDALTTGGPLRYVVTAERVN